MFGIEYLAFDAQRLEAVIRIRNKSSKPAKLANVQLLGCPIFNIQLPIFGIEYLAFDAQRLELPIFGIEY